jgi:ABC-type transport system involved in multi-copper enzyme maturation permease subunit
MNARTFLFPACRSIDDWLSPILVKELRQGMRARVFVISYLLLQVFLSVLVLANAAAQGDSRALEDESHYFWVIVGFALLVLMPLRGLVAVSQEVRNRTMETIMLTRLTAWRVVFGKWSALFAQSLLLVSAVLPYVVLRYFIGGDDIVSDFVWMIIFLWLSGILIAASIAISGLANVVVRIVLLIGMVGAFSGAASSFATPGFSFGSPWEVAGWMVIYGFFVPALLFELTASGLAPASENHAVRRRVLAVAFFALSFPMAVFTKPDFEGAIIVPLLVVVGVCYYELSEKPRVIPRMVRSFAPWNVLGRIGAAFLLPGWPSGLLFSLAAIPLAMSLFFSLIPADPSTMAYLPFLTIVSVFGSVLVPIFICHTFLPRLNQVLLMVVLYNIILLGVASVLEGFAALTHTGIAPLLAFVPSVPVQFVAMNATEDAFKYNVDWYVLVNMIVVSLVGLLLLLGSRRFFQEVYAVFRPTEPVRPPESSITPP